MKSIIRAFVLLAVAFAAPVALEAQAKKIPPGLYQVVPDANFSAPMDVAGILVEFTDTHMTATMQGQVMVKSRISFAGDVVTIEDLEGQVACPGTAKYKVSTTDKGIRITPVEDPCPERGQILSQVTMVKKG